MKKEERAWERFLTDQDMTPPKFCSCQKCISRMKNHEENKLKWKEILQNDWSMSAESHKDKLRLWKCSPKKVIKEL